MVIQEFLLIHNSGYCLISEKLIINIFFYVTRSYDLIFYITVFKLGLEYQDHLAVTF